MSEHLLGHVTGNGHYGPVACLGFSELGDRVVPQIVESQTGRRYENLTGTPYRAPA